MLRRFLGERGLALRNFRFNERPCVLVVHDWNSLDELGVAADPGKVMLPAKRCIAVLTDDSPEQGMLRAHWIPHARTYPASIVQQRRR
jgi:hypothetical protein